MFLFHDSYILLLHPSRVYFRLWYEVCIFCFKCLSFIFSKQLFQNDFGNNSFSYLQLFNGIHFVLFYTQVGLFSRLCASSLVFLLLLFIFFCLFFKKKSLKVIFDRSPQSASVEGIMRKEAHLGPLGSQSGWGSQMVFCSPLSCFQRT